MSNVSRYYSPMDRCISLLLITISAAAVAAPVVEVTEPLPLLEIHVEGPMGRLEMQCEVPCERYDVEIVGVTDSQTTFEVGKASEVDDGRARTRSRDGRGECQGACGARERTTTLTIRPSRELREGIEVEVHGRRATITIHDIVEYEGERTGRRRIAEVLIDRLPIEISVHDHTIGIYALD